MRSLGARIPFVLGTALVLLAALVLRARPGTARPAPEGVEVILCLDVSRSMLARDVAPDRLSRAKAEIGALAEVAQGDALGLVLFAGEARLLVPRTQDGASLAEMARRAGPWDVPRGGTDLAAALTAAREALAGRSGPGAIVILGDGEDLAARETASVATALRREGIAVHALGLGTARGAKIPADGRFLRGPDGAEVITRLEPRDLRRVADATGGTYRAVEDTTLPALYADVIRPTARATQARAAGRGFGDTASWLLLFGVLLLALDLAGLGVRGRIRAPRAGLAALGLVGVLLGGCGAAPGVTVDPEIHATFLRGNRAYADSVELEQAAADAPAKERRDLMRAAYRRAEDALAAWQWAAATRMDWPEARRNVERGLLRMRALRGHGTEGGRPNARQAPGTEPARDDPSKDDPGKEDPPQAPETPEDPPTDPTARIEARALPAERVPGILDALRRAERQKIELRKARRTVRPPVGGRDW